MCVCVCVCVIDVQIFCKITKNRCTICGESSNMEGELPRLSTLSMHVQRFIVVSLSVIVTSSTTLPDLMLSMHAQRFIVVSLSVILSVTSSTTLPDLMLQLLYRQCSYPAIKLQSKFTIIICNQLVNIFGSSFCKSCRLLDGQCHSK